MSPPALTAPGLGPWATRSRCTGMYLRSHKRQLHRVSHSCCGRAEEERPPAPAKGHTHLIAATPPRRRKTAGLSAPGAAAGDAGARLPHGSWGTRLVQSYRAPRQGAHNTRRLQHHRPAGLEVQRIFCSAFRQLLEQICFKGKNQCGNSPIRDAFSPSSHDTGR